MNKAKPALILAFKAVSSALAAMSIIFIGIGETSNEIHVIFLALGLLVLSIALIMQHGGQTLFEDTADGFNWYVPSRLNFKRVP